MDLDLLRQKLDTLQSKKGPTGKTDYSKIYWKPSIGKQQIRIVPSAHRINDPFMEMKLHYGIGPNKIMVSPLNFGEKDPIFEFSQKLRSGEYDKNTYILAKSLEPKTRYFVPVLVRGEEDKGVRLWQFGSQIYTELLALAVDDEIGDYTDIVEGRDLTVETVGPETTGTNYNKSSVRVRLKTSPLSKDPAQVETWTSEQPNPKEGLFKNYSYDEMKDALRKHLEVDSEEEETLPPSPITKESTPNPPGNFNLDTSNVKQNKTDKFDTLFSDGSKPKIKPLSEFDEDDLPF